MCINEYTLPGYLIFATSIEGVACPKKCQLCSFCRTAKVTKSGSLFDVDFRCAGRSNSGSEFDHFLGVRKHPPEGGYSGPPKNPARAPGEGGYPPPRGVQKPPLPGGPKVAKTSQFYPPILPSYPRGRGVLRVLEGGPPTPLPGGGYPPPPPGGGSGGVFLDPLRDPEFGVPEGVQKVVEFGPRIRHFLDPSFGVPKSHFFRHRFDVKKVTISGPRFRDHFWTPPLTFWGPEIATFGPPLRRGGTPPPGG